MRKIIVVSLIGIVIVCIILIIIFLIQDSIKSKKKAVIAKTTGPEVKYDSKNCSMTETENDIDSENDKSSVQQKAIIHTTEIEEEKQEKKEDVIREEEVMQPDAVTTDKVECDVNKPLNPLPVRKALSDNEMKEIGFVRSATKENYIALLENIAKELSVMANSSGKFMINYLKDDMENLEFENGYFLLRNEEALINGMLQDKDTYYIEAYDRVTLRFCVSLSLPDNYKMEIIPDKEKLHKKGILVKGLIQSLDTATSLRVVVFPTEECVITRDEVLFKVRIYEEGDSYDTNI